jgi:hypothetical protein
MKTVKQTSTVDCSWKTLTNRQVLLKLHYLNNVIINETTILLARFLSTFNIIREKLVVNNFLCKYFIKQLNPPCL